MVTLWVRISDKFGDGGWGGMGLYGWLMFVRAALAYLVRFYVAEGCVCLAVLPG